MHKPAIFHRLDGSFAGGRRCPPAADSDRKVAWAVGDGRGRPYDAVPAQFSLHVLRREDAAPEHHAFLAGPATDPRPALAAALVDATRGLDVLVAYNAPFERKAIS